jgi:hypothetical protein
MTGSEVEKLIEEARALLFIPGIGKALKHKILELKAAISRNIDYYQTAEETEVEKKPHTLKGTRFKITRIQENLWIPSIPGNTCNDIYQVIPQPIVDYIVDNVGNTGVINMQNGLKFPGLKGRVFDLSFEKQNDYCITGIIHEVKENGVDSISPDNLAAAMGLPAVTGKTEKIEVIKLLAYYLAAYDDFYDHVVSLFKINWKLLIDNQILSDVNVR